MCTFSLIINAHLLPVGVIQRTVKIINVDLDDYVYTGTEDEIAG